MNSHTTKRFRNAFKNLTKPVQRQAREAFKLFQDNPYHPSLRFKQVHPSKPVYSVRVTRDYRALGVRDEDELVWFWIGSHTDYEQFLSRI
jgi:hypothetical protein